MFLVLILAFFSLTSAEESIEAQPSKCNCTRLLNGEETTTELSPTFPTTSFTCWDRYDGYYADIEVDCTIFHYCQTWHYPTGLNETVKWDFACPQSTVFNQKILSCTPPNISFDCQESPNYFWVNYNLTSTTTTPAPTPAPEFTTPISNPGQQLIVGGVGQKLDASSDSTQSSEPTEPTNAQYQEFLQTNSGSDLLSSGVSDKENNSDAITFPL